MNLPATETPSPFPTAPTRAPGVYPDISNHDYHEGPGISNSGLSVLIDYSPLHYWDRRLNPDRPRPSEPSPQLVMGSALHKYVLEPLSFDDEFILEPEGIDRRTKDGKARWAEFQLQAGGKGILSADMLERVRGMANALMNHPTARRLLESGQVEQSLYWNDPETGVLCKARPDWMADVFLVDLKTTTDASLAEFQRSIHNFGYHRQAAFYLQGLSHLFGDKHANFVFLAVESQRPFAVAPYAIDDASLARGRAEIRKALALYARCLETNTWPGYHEAVTAISLPPWAFKQTV